MSSATAVPIWTAEAPAKKNSTASRQFETPPHPIIGISYWSAMSYTQRNATGFMHAPDKPPFVLARIGIWVSASMAMARRVLVAVRASAPASIAA